VTTKAIPVLATTEGFNSRSMDSPQLGQAHLQILLQLQNLEEDCPTLIRLTDLEDVIVTVLLPTTQIFLSWGPNLRLSQIGRLRAYHRHIMLTMDHVEATHVLDMIMTESTIVMKEAVARCLGVEPVIQD
jgi:hypothetical protein